MNGEELPSERSSSEKTRKPRGCVEFKMEYLKEEESLAEFCLKVKVRTEKGSQRWQRGHWSA